MWSLIRASQWRGSIASKFRPRKGFSFERKASLESKNVYGGTALGAATWAVMHSDPVYRWPDPDVDWVAIVETLLAAGADVRQADYPTGNERVDDVLRRARARIGIGD